MIYRCPKCPYCDLQQHNLYVAAATTANLWDHWKYLLKEDQREVVQKQIDTLKKAVDDCKNP
jgi:hypothetical protein